MKRLKEISVKYHLKVLPPNDDMTFNVKSINVLSGVRAWKNASKKFHEECMIFEVYEDGIKVEIPIDRRGGNNNKGVTKTKITYYADIELLALLKKQEDVNQFINQAVLEKLERINNHNQEK